MKKYLWIVALIAALAMVMAGCDNGGGGGGDGGTTEIEYEEQTVFVLTDYLAELVGDGIFTKNTDINTASSSTVFEDLKIQAAGEIGLKVVDNGTKLALEIDTKTFNWGAGIDLKNSKLNFSEKDVITVSGRILADFPPAPTGNDSWAEPILYLTFDHGTGTDRPSIADDLTADATYSYTSKGLTPTNVYTISTNSPSAVRIGARPAGAKFTIDEITIVRQVPKVKVEYTVSFFAGKTETTALGTVKVESGKFVAKPTRSDTWYANFLDGLDATKQFDKWLNKDDDVEWVWSTGVTKDIGLYAVLADKEALKAGFIALGAPDVNTWYTNGRDSKVTDLDYNTFKAAKFIIFKATHHKGDGIGGVQLAFQGDADGDAWHCFTTGDWTSSSWSSTDATIYVVFNLSSPTDVASAWSAVTGDGGSDGKFIINFIPAETDGTKHITVTAGYLYTGTTALTIPTTNAQAFGSGANISGWITSVAQMAP